MSAATPPITNFTAGEWSPRLYGRVDIARYGQACSELVNMSIMPHGPAARRMGTRCVAAALPGARLMEFIFNTEQAYVLELSPGRMRFFRDGGLLEGRDLETPYTAADVAALGFCQAADLMYLVCPGIAPHKLERPGADIFTLRPVAFVSPPAEWTPAAPETDSAPASPGSYPACATFWQQRLWLAGCPKHPNKIWASATGDFENFTGGTAEDRALSLSLVSEQVNAIRWLLAGKNLVAGTSYGEWIIQGGDAAVTNKNVSARLNSNYGAAAVRPLIAGAASCHVSADGKRLRSFFYDYGTDSHLSRELSLLAEHLTRPGIAAIANCQNPDGIIWCVMKDGSMAGCTWLMEQEVTGWHRFETAGKIRSVCCVPAEDHTQTWIVAERECGSFIEIMAPPWDGESAADPGCFYVDCGLLYEGPPADRLSGLEHLEGMEIAVLADGAEHPRKTVHNGEIGLDFPASVVAAGLPYEWRLSPMRLEGFSPRGTVQTKNVLLSELAVRFYKTLGARWTRPSSRGGRGAGAKGWEIPFRRAEGKMDEPPAPFTGDALLSMPGGWHEDSRVRLFGDGALPACVLMIVPVASVNR